MVENYAELTLYYACCDNPADIRGNLNGKYLESQKMRSIAMHSIWKAIDLDKELHTLNYGIHGCIENEQAAKSLIDYIRKEITGSIDMADPYDALHGVIRFYRKIRIPEFTKDRKQELKENLKDS